jgi:enterochelin esterase-like enzyme
MSKHLFGRVLLILPSLILGACIGCTVAPLPTTEGSEGRSITQPTSNPCDKVESLAPGRPTIPPPAVIPVPQISPLPQYAAARSDLVDTLFYSQIVEKEEPTLIYLPPGYNDSRKRYPVLYLLSGFAGDYREWVTYGLCREIDALVRSGLVQPMIVAMPDGDYSWWFNHAPVAGSDGKRWGDYVWKDVVGFVDTNYRTLRSRASRAIGGLSAGGQSSLMLGLTHPEVFGVVGAHSPSMRGADGSLAIYGDREYFKRYDPIWLIQNTYTRNQLTIWIDVGRDDQQWGNAIEDFHVLLDRYNVSHEFQDTWPGIHESSYWAMHLADYLKWYSAKLKGE